MENNFLSGMYTVHPQWMLMLCVKCGFKFLIRIPMLLLGPIPNTIGSLKSLNALMLGLNSFSGKHSGSYSLPIHTSLCFRINFFNVVV